MCSFVCTFFFFYTFCGSVCHVVSFLPSKLRDALSMADKCMQFNEGCHDLSIT